VDRQLPPLSAAPNDSHREGSRLYNVCSGRWISVHWLLVRLLLDSFLHGLGQGHTTHLQSLRSMSRGRERKQKYVTLRPFERDCSWLVFIGFSTNCLPSLHTLCVPCPSIIDELAALLLLLNWSRSLPNSTVVKQFGVKTLSHA